MKQNVDPQELAKFSSLAAHWWDLEGEVNTLHHINPLRVEYIKEKVNLEGKSVMDVGCGGGILTEALARSGAKATGIDLNKSLIEVANLHQLESGTKVEYLHTSAEAIAAARAGEYDIVTCLELLEHVPDPASVVKACALLVKPGGHVFFSTLNRNPKSYLFAIIGAEYILKMLPRNTHDYAKFIKPAELSQWARKAGLSASETKGMAYNPFNRKFSLSNDISVNYLFYATKPAHHDTLSGHTV